jgi:hypothetical protein
MKQAPGMFKEKNNLIKLFYGVGIAGILLSSCGKKSSGTTPVTPPPPASFSATSITVNGKQGTSLDYNINTVPVIKFSFSAPIDHASVNNSFSFAETSGTSVSFNAAYSSVDSVVIIQPSGSLKYLTKYIVTTSTGLKSKAGGGLKTAATLNFITQIDSSDKFTRISDDALLDLIQQQTLKYFTDFAHPVSGMARERNTSADVVTAGGTGFGVMSVIVGVNRNFITRAEGLQRINTIVNFLKNNCTRYHACQYFNTADANEVSLRTNVNVLWDGIEWNWFRQAGQNVLYWHWSPNYNFQINQPINGWDEALIVYALAASSNTDSIHRIVYDNGWALNGGIKNGNTYYGVQLPLGPDLGGPLFFSQYSFLGINPHDLTDAYANYFTQNTNHSLINYNYCVANPNNFYGYSSTDWGLTASDDDISGYNAHAPGNDDGVITPSAAISSLPYTPAQSMNALKFFYYTLGDKLWKQYGFVDAFNLKDLWFADSFLAIDQGPQIVMIENYRSGLLWNLFMSCPEIKRGMKQLGFQSPDL